MIVLMLVEYVYSFGVYYFYFIVYTFYFKYGHADMGSGTGWNGCYATHIVLRKGTHIVKLPDNVKDKIGATLNCAFASMTNAVEPLMDLYNLEKNQEANKKKSVLVQVCSTVIRKATKVFFL